MALPKRPTGFAIPGYAASAAKKGQALGLCRRFTPAEAREAVRKRGPLRRDVTGKFVAGGEAPKA